MGFGDNQPPALRLEAHFATLHSTNHIHLLWIVPVSWDLYQVRWAAGDDPEVQVRLGSDQIVLSHDDLVGEWDLAPTIPGITYHVKIQGCNQGLFGSLPAHCSPFSGAEEAVAAKNSSTRAFLAASGIDLSQRVGIRALVPAALAISLRALLAGP